MQRGATARAGRTSDRRSFGVTAEAVQAPLRGAALAETEDGRATGSLVKGVAANALNPAPYLFWVGIGAPLLMEAAADGWVWALLFVTCFYGCLVGAKVCTAVAVERSRRFLSSRFYVGAVRLLGALLIGFAVQFGVKAAGHFGWL